MRVSASHQAPSWSHEFLGRELAFLFEHYFYYLEEFPPDTRGLIVFDELEKSFGQKAFRRIEDYFLRIGPGRIRSSRIIPEPFFVHSDLTTGSQTADVVVYIINWAHRFGGMSDPIRAELSPLLIGYRRWFTIPVGLMKSASRGLCWV